MYDYPKVKKDINNTGVGILELSNTAQEYIKELFNKHSMKELISLRGTLHVETTSRMVAHGLDTYGKLVYDPNLDTKLKEKIIDINKTIKSKDISYDENTHNPNDESAHESLWYIRGSYEKLTILRKWLVDNYKKSIYQMWYEIPLQNIINPSGVDVTKIHQELTKIYLELYGDLEEVQNFGKEYNSEESLQQTFRLQVYEEGCSLSPHTDGAPAAHCSMLLYTNEDYVEGMGGELVCIDTKGKEITVPPTIGTLAIIDFKEDPSHSVNVIKEKDWMRTTIGSWWPAGVQY